MDDEVAKAAERLREMRDDKSHWASKSLVERTALNLEWKEHATVVVDAYLAEQRPQWLELPSGPGLWVCMPDGKRVHQPQVIDLNEADIKRGAPFYAPRVYGPIPKDDGQKSRA